VKRPFGKIFFWQNDLLVKWFWFILLKNHFIERHLTEKSVGQTPFDRKFISPKGHLTDFFLKIRLTETFSTKNVILPKKVRQRII
jgi:hypothetical protein